MARQRSRNDTEYLSASPANARRLLASIRAFDQGEGVERKLIEPMKAAQKKRTSKEM